MPLVIMHWCINCPTLSALSRVQALKGKNTSKKTF
uniref:Uncharacterized protein n=1 Tax=Anguilla anguilla TaxID=7936 RepID=A0A0E9W9D6_ANGAN